MQRGERDPRRTPRDVSVTIRGMSVDEDLVHFVRGRCRIIPSGDVDVLIERRGAGVTVDVELGSRDPTDALYARQEDPDPFLAVRNAFCVLAHLCEQRTLLTACAAE